MRKRTVIVLLVAVLLVLLLVGVFLQIKSVRKQELQKQEQMELAEKNKKEQEKKEGVEDEVEDELQKEQMDEAPEEVLEEIADDAYVRVLDFIPDIEIDLKYATADNFTGQVIYSFKECYLRYGTVKKLAVAQEQFKALGYRIKIWDGYRPFFAQQRLWDVCPNPRYVANPAKGMRAHNLGGTIDMTLVTLAGDEVEMPTGFDDFSLLADRDYSDVSEAAANNARMMENIMYACGFTGCSSEWWDYSDVTTYAPVDFQP